MPSILLFWEDKTFSIQPFSYNAPGSFFRLIYELEELINSGNLIGLILTHEINLILSKDIKEYVSLNRKEKLEWKKGSAINFLVLHKEYKNNDILYDTTSVNSFNDLMIIHGKKYPQNQQYNILYDKLVKTLEKNTPLRVKPLSGVFFI